MDKEKLKLIVRNLELLVDSLKVEIYSDQPAHSTSLDTNRFSALSDYDEIFEEYDD